MSNLKLQAAGVHNTIDSICILLACIQGGWTPAYLLFCISFSSKHELSCLHNEYATPALANNELKTLPGWILGKLFFVS